MKRVLLLLLLCPALISAGCSVPGDSSTTLQILDVDVTYGDTDLGEVAIDITVKNTGSAIAKNVTVVAVDYPEEEIDSLIGNTSLMAEVMTDPRYDSIRLDAGHLGDVAPGAVETVRLNRSIEGVLEGWEAVKLAKADNAPPVAY
jgi:hypothetical protein